MLFDERVKGRTLGFPDGILADLLHVLEIIEELGPAVGKPYTAPMGKGLLESVGSNISPKLSTIADYAEATDYKLKIDFVPRG